VVLKWTQLFALQCSRKTVKNRVLLLASKTLIRNAPTHRSVAKVLHLNINLDWLSAKGLPILGLDISTTAVSWWNCPTRAGHAAGGTPCHRALPKDAVTDGNIANLDQVADTLRRLENLGSRIKTLRLPAVIVDHAKKILAPA
jgi:hypothetical protein